MREVQLLPSHHTIWKGEAQSSGRVTACWDRAAHQGPSWWPPPVGQEPSHTHRFPASRNSRRPPQGPAVREVKSRSLWADLSPLRSRTRKQITGGEGKNIPEGLQCCPGQLESTVHQDTEEAAWHHRGQIQSESSLAWGWALGVEPGWGSERWGFASRLKQRCWQLGPPDKRGRCPTLRIPSPETSTSLSKILFASWNSELAIIFKWVTVYWVFIGFWAFFSLYFWLIFLLCHLILLNMDLKTYFLCRYSFSRLYFVTDFYLLFMSTW